MSSIRILLNGEHKQTVSLEGLPGVLSCLVNYRKESADDGNPNPVEDYHILSGGIDNASSEYVDWPRIELSVGDQIEFEILPEAIADPPASRRDTPRDS